MKKCRGLTRAEGNRNSKEGQEMVGFEEYIGKRDIGVKDAMDIFGKRLSFVIEIVLILRRSSYSV